VTTKYLKKESNVQTAKGADIPEKIIPMKRLFQLAVRLTVGGNA
jgi:hypothetical protein